ncbi:MAG: superoxide dismutase family protein, partial [Lysinibacillus sp.]|nr:superoxide dismutase family protein [Lysinibacillus sp.]
LLLSGCSFFGFTKNEEEQIPTHAEEALSAKATMIDTEGNEMGIVQFMETSEGVKVQVQLKNVPDGEHGFHIHEVGKCEKPSFESAGAHFNPDGRKHGFENPQGPHAGDLPNVVAKEGIVNVEFVAEGFTLKKGQKHSLFDEDGSSIVLHEAPDDYKTDPAGDSGARIACGVIESK